MAYNSTTLARCKARLQVSMAASICPAYAKANADGPNPTAVVFLDVGVSFSLRGQQVPLGIQPQTTWPCFCHQINSRDLTPLLLSLTTC